MIDEPRYAELHAHSAFTFLEGTDEPADMVAQASRLGLEALAILDVDGMYSTVQTTMAARSCGLTRDSVILLEQVRTLDKSRLRERMGRLDEPAMHQVDNAIAVSFGLPQ